MEIEIAMKLKFRLKAPTVNAWANRLCAQWDMWINREGGGIAARFKGADNDVTMSIFRVITIGDGLPSI